MLHFQGVRMLQNYAHSLKGGEGGGYPDLLVHRVAEGHGEAVPCAPIPEAGGRHHRRHQPPIQWIGAHSRLHHFRQGEQILQGREVGGPVLHTHTDFLV